MKETRGQDLCIVVEAPAKGDVAGRAAREPAPAPHSTYRFIDRTMHKATPEQFADECRRQGMQLTSPFESKIRREVLIPPGATLLCFLGFRARAA